MAAFNFKPQFVPPIESGVKGGTIRAYRRYPQKLGKPMHLFSGLRQISPAPRIEVPGLGSSPLCVAMNSIVVTRDKRVFVSAALGLPKASAFKTPHLFGRQLSLGDCERLAIFDGFDSFEQMMTFWDGRLPFLGHWCCWARPELHTIRNRRASA